MGKNSKTDKNFEHDSFFTRGDFFRWKESLISLPVLPFSWSVQNELAIFLLGSLCSLSRIPTHEKLRCRETKPPSCTSWRQHCWVHLSINNKSTENETLRLNNVHEIQQKERAWMDTNGQEWSGLHLGNHEKSRPNISQVYGQSPG